MSEPTPANLRQLLRWLLGITRPVHAPLLISTVFRIINLTLDLALFATAAGGVISLISGGGSTGKLLVILVVLSLTKALAFYFEQFTGHYVAFKALELLRVYVFSKLWPKAPAIVSHSRSGDLLTSLTRDVDRIEVVYAHTFAPVVSAYLVGLGAVVVAASRVGWEPIWIATTCLMISLFVIPFVGTRASMIGTREVLAQRRALTHHVSDTIHGIDEVLGYGRGAERLEEMEAEGNVIAELSTHARDLTGLRRGSNVFLSIVATASVVAAGWDILEPAVIAGLAAATFRAFEGPRGIEDATGYLDHSLAAARRLWEISNAPERVHDGNEVFSAETSPEIRFDAVTYRYPDVNSMNAVDNVSLTVPAGGHAILVGRSGSGKSTLVQLLQRYDDPTSGRVTINGEALDGFTLDSLRRGVVSVSQKNQLLQATIAQNLRLGAPEASDDDLWCALKTAGLDDEVAAMPDRLATHVGKTGLALSGGQVQRLCLARTVLMDPKVLILDEFTANLNIDLELQIRRTLRDALPDATIIEVTHRLRATEEADVIAVLDKGHLVASGTPEEISQDKIAEIFSEAAAA